MPVHWPAPGAVLIFFFVLSTLHPSSDQLTEMFAAFFYMSIGLFAIDLFMGFWVFYPLYNGLLVLENNENISGEETEKLWRLIMDFPTKSIYVSASLWIVGNLIFGVWMFSSGVLQFGEVLLVTPCSALLGISTSMAYYLRARSLFRPVLRIITPRLPKNLKIEHKRKTIKRLSFSFLIIWCSISFSLTAHAWTWYNNASKEPAINSAIKKSGELSAILAGSTDKNLSFETEDHINYKLYPFILSKDLKESDGKITADEIHSVKTGMRFLGRQEWIKAHPYKAWVMSFFEARYPVPPYQLVEPLTTEDKIKEWFNKKLDYYYNGNMVERWLVISDTSVSPGGYLGVVLEINMNMEGHPLIKRAEIILFFVIFVSLGFLIAVLFILWLANDVSEPLNELAEAMIDHDDEDYIGQAALLGDDEIGELAATFNSLNERLRKGNRKKEELLLALRQAGSNLGDVMERLVVIASEHGSDSAEQAASLQQISSTSEQIAATLRGIAENTQMVEEVAGRSLSACGTGQQQLGDLISSMDGAIGKVKDVANRMILFHEQTNRIENVLNFIRDVSEKINIIALNASIEASASGDSGSRFQILAASMRELAEKTMSGSKETKEMFAELQSASNSAIIATEESEKQVEKAKEMAELAADSFQQIIHWAGETVRTTQEISISSNQQTSASDHLAEALSEIKEVASKYAEAGNVIEKSLVEISGTSRQIEGLLKQSVKDEDDFSGK